APKLKDKLTGLEYIYIGPDAHGKVTKRTSGTKLIDDPKGILANTLQPLFTNTMDFGFISYSDQPPDGRSVSNTHGHSKGVLMVDKTTAVWLLHSTPRFPYKREENCFYPLSGTRNAQTFICVTFKYDQFRAIGNVAFNFDDHIPDSFKKDFTDAVNEAGVNPLYNAFQSLTSRGGQQFGSIAKQQSPDDLYFAIASLPEVNSNVLVQTWGGQDDRDKSYCPKNGKDVNNIIYVVTDLGDWEPGNDHSKWCVAKDKPLTCIADVNRADSQFRRPGGALCIDNEKIKNIFNKFLQKPVDCQNIQLFIQMYGTILLYTFSQRLHFSIEQVPRLQDFQLLNSLLCC
uniref:Deoxyribonuclease-2-alpha n=1 Tax=Lates calcarifer TaxID=8187 RepID=A0A4W6EGW0_LATCA